MWKLYIFMFSFFLTYPLFYRQIFGPWFLWHDFTWYPSCQVCPYNYTGLVMLNILWQYILFYYYDESNSSLTDFSWWDNSSTGLTRIIKIPEYVFYTRVLTCSTFNRSEQLAVLYQWDKYDACCFCDE